MKRGIILLFAICVLFVLSSVCAGDVDDVRVSSDNATAIELSQGVEITDEEISQTDDNEMLFSDNAENDSNVLMADEGKYSDLASEIGNGGDKNLTYKHYTYDEGSTITISTAGTIDGKGAVIDMAGSNIRVFQVNVDGVTFKNLTIKNAEFTGYGVVIYFNGQGSVENCNFINNKGTGGYTEGGAILMFNGSLTNCNFINNYAKSGGAVYVLSDSELTNCNFTNNSAESGGAVYTFANGNLTNCNFINNSAKSGGALYFYDTGKVTNCNFNNNQVNGDDDSSCGGAICFAGKGNLTDCNFINNSARFGGALYIVADSNVTNCNFTDNSAYYGGAIWTYSGTVENCNLFNNTAFYTGGAIFMHSGNVENCNLVDNHADVASAVYMELDCQIIDNWWGSNNPDWNDLTNGKKPLRHVVLKVSADTITIDPGCKEKLHYGFYISGTDHLICLPARPIALSSTGGQLDNTSGYLVREFSTEFSAVLKGTYEITATVDNQDVKIKVFVMAISTIYVNATAAPGGDGMSEATAFQTLKDALDVAGYNDTIMIASGTYIGEYNVGLTIDVKLSFVKYGVDEAIFDAQGMNRIFTVNVGTTVIDGVTFKNAKVNGKGGAIYFSVSGNVTNCRFTNNQATGNDGYGGAVYFAESGNVINCSFADNLANQGGAIRFASDGNVTDCNFANNSITGDSGCGGAIYFASDYTGCVLNCNFNNNTANLDGGAICFAEDSTGIVTNCNFFNNKAYSHGGAIYFNHKSNVSDCYFANNSITGDSGCGGAIYFASDYTGCVLNCNFNNNTANLDGGAICFAEDSTGFVTNCNFFNNKAYYQGGAIYFNRNGNVTNCNFANNQATDYYGGAIYFTGNGNVTDCNFTNNSAKYNGGAVLMNSGSVTNCNFFNSETYYNGGAIEFMGTGNVTNCNFTNNKVTGDNGGAIYFTGNGNVTDCNFANNSAKCNGGAVRMNSGSVTNCNFTNNLATCDGGAVYFNLDGEVTNCNFTNNTAQKGGAIRSSGKSSVGNCNFVDNQATGDSSQGGAVWMYSASVTNCNFINNKLLYGSTSFISRCYGGAIYFQQNAEVMNCNFTNNSATLRGGAIFMDNGNVTNCNFVNNSADDWGGAVMFNIAGTVTDCNFTDNHATTGGSYGGAIGFSATGNVTNCNFVNNSASKWGGAVMFHGSGTVTDCNFANNCAVDGGAVFSYDLLAVVVDTCIFKTDSDSTFNTQNIPPTLNVDNFTTFYNSGEKLTFDLRTNSNMSICNGNISISVYYKNNDRWFGNYSCLSGEGWTVDLPVGSYYAIFDTEYAEFKPINRTITITLPDTQFYANVTSLTTNNRTVNITAKSNIPENLFIDGKLVFILPDGVEINATYAAGDIWWAVHTFEDYADYPVNASYTGLDDVTINNATISITRADSTVNVSDVVMDYGDSKKVTVITEGATGITAKINDNPVDVINNYTIVISGLDVGNYTLTVTTLPDNDHISVTKTVNVTVNKVDSTLIVKDVTVVYGFSTNLTVTTDGAIGITARIGDKNLTVNNNTVIIPVLDAGTYTLTVTTVPDKGHSAVTANATITVNMLNTQITANAVTTTYNVNKNLVITLKDSKGNALSGAVITVNLNGAKTYTTDKNGQVKINVAKLVPKTYTAKITFNGNKNYKASAANVKVTVKKAKSKILAKKKTFKKSKKIKKYTITLKSGKNPIKKVKVTLKIKKKTYRATTNAKGKATFKIKNLKKKGTFKATIKFKGNKYYNKVTKKVKIKIK